VSKAYVRGPDGKLHLEVKQKKQLELPFRGDVEHPQPKDEDIELHEAQASMSKSEIVLNCQWWINRPVPKETVSYEARYGSAFHEAMALKLITPPKNGSLRSIVRRWNGEEDDELIEFDGFKTHVKGTLEYLRGWLAGDNQWKVNFIKRAQARVEQSFAWNVMKKKARATARPSEGHIYKGVRSRDEFPGTADFVIDKIETKKDAPDIILIDHKTSETCDLPKESGQVKSLLMAAAKRMGYRRPAGGILHTPRGGSAFLYIEDFSKEILDEHAEKLKAVWREIGKGTLRPGPWCTKGAMPCPALAICPAHTSQIGQLEIFERGSITAEKIGRAHEIMARFKAWSRAFSTTVMRPWVVKNGPAPRPDGKLVALRKKTVRNLSMAGITRLKGPLRGGKIIARLEKRGLIEVQEREELVAVDDK
jgi:hypothetical protein